MPSYLGVAVGQVGYRVIFVELQGHRRPGDDARRAAAAAVTVHASSFHAFFTYLCDCGKARRPRGKGKRQEAEGGQPVLAGVQPS